jgi:uncharacterized membrane protein YccC
VRNYLPSIAAVLLLMAVLPLPYGYYTFLRVSVTTCALLVAWFAYTEKGEPTVWVLVFGLVAILFNPLIPIYLSRGIWFYLDIGIAVIFAVWWFLDKRKNHI